MKRHEVCGTGERTLGDGPKREELNVRREDSGGRWGMGCKEEGDALKGLVNY